MIWTSVKSIDSELRGTFSRYVIHIKEARKPHEQSTQVLYRGIQT